MKLLSPPHIQSAYTFAVICALISALLYGVTIPFKKYFLDGIDPIAGAVFLQLGMGIGMLILYLAKSGLTRNAPRKPDEKIQKSDYKVIIFAILIATCATILLNIGLTISSAATASILNNFEIVATALIALLIFKEKISKRLWIGIILITIGSITLSIKDNASFAFSAGSILVILSCISYGLKNNLMKVLSKRNPIVIIMLMGFGCALLSFIIALCMGCPFPQIDRILSLMLLGFATSGLSSIFLMLAQRHLGAAKASAIRGITPVIAVVISFLVFSEMPTFGFLASLILIFPGLYFASTRNKDTVVEVRSESAEEDRNSFLASEKYEHGRKYFTAFGCLIVAALFGFPILKYANRYLSLIQFTDEMYNPADNFAMSVIIMSLLLLLCGVILLIVRRRVLAAVSFIFVASQMILGQILTDYFALKVGLAVMSIVFALMILTSKGRQKYIFAMIHFLFGISMLAHLFASVSFGFIIQVFVSSVAIIFLVYIAVVSVSTRDNLPLKELLCTYEKTDFKTCVPVLGYIFIAMYGIGNIIFLVSGLSELDYNLNDPFYYAVMVLTAMLVLLGILLFFIGKLGFISVMFIGFGFCILAVSTTNILTMYCIAMVFLVLGVFALCQEYSNILRSLLLIFSGIVSLLFPMLWGFPDVLPAVVGMTVLTTVLALYMAVSSISDKPKLPVF